MGQETVASGIDFKQKKNRIVWILEGLGAGTDDHREMKRARLEKRSSHITMGGGRHHDGFIRLHKS